MKKYGKIFWPALLNGVFLSLYALCVRDFYAPDSLGIYDFLYLPSAAVCLFVSPVTGVVQFLYFAHRFGKTRDRHYFYHLYASLLTGLGFLTLLVLIEAGGFYITV